MLESRQARARRWRATAAVLITGAELLDGRVHDENGCFLASSLTEAGFQVLAVVFAPDDADHITRHLQALLALRPTVIVVSGGLGTTHDDVTMEAVARAANVPLVESDEAWNIVRERVRAVAHRHGLSAEPLLRQARKQALLPEGANMLAPAGTAPGARLTLSGASVVVLPGVPHELRSMWSVCLPTIAEAAGASAGAVAIVRITEVGEMQVAPLLEPFLGEPLDIAITAAWGDITVRLATHEEDGERLLPVVQERLAESFQVYSTDGRTLDQMIADRLRDERATLACAESCTGGLLGGRITAVAGSSEYFVGSIVAYANAAKTAALGVSPSLLTEHGAVSADCAQAMAAGVRSLLGSTYALSTTGIAGPGGGSVAKPVGLVYIGIASPRGVRAVEKRFMGERNVVRQWTVQTCLHVLREEMERRP